MIDQTPLVSVITATYRREKEIERALSSLAAQTYPCVEVIVVDDNGDLLWNEKVRHIIQSVSFEHTEFTIRYIANPTNLGSAVSRNIGIEAANGEYVTFLDDDDVYLPEKIANQLSAMQACNAEYSLTDLYLYNERDKLSDMRRHRDVPAYSSEELLQYHLLHHLTGTDCLMFKKSYLQHIGCFPKINVGDEFYLMCNAIQGGGVFCYIPECHVKAYVHSGENGGLSSGQGKIDGENALYAFKKLYFDRMIPKNKRYVRMRHYAVLAFAHLRSKHYLRFALDSFKAFFSAPFAFALLLIQKSE